MYLGLIECCLDGEISRSRRIRHPVRSCRTRHDMKSAALLSEPCIIERHACLLFGSVNPPFPSRNFDAAINNSARTFDGWTARAADKLFPDKEECDK
jgi:hypothetical protein